MGILVGTILIVLLIGLGLYLLGRAIIRDIPHIGGR